MKNSTTRSNPSASLAEYVKHSSRVIRSLGMLSVLLLVLAPVTQALASADAVASYYGKRFHGRTTASGKPFNMHAMTAAHKSWRFGTKVRVTNKANGRSVVVTINDRGPYIGGRALDLSLGAAKKIGMVHAGTARVRVEQIGRAGRGSKASLPAAARIPDKLVLMDLF